MKNKILKLSLSFLICLSTLNSYANELNKNNLTYETMYDDASMSYYKKGRLLYNNISQKNLEEAIKTYDQGISINKNNPLLYASKVEALFLLYIFKFFKFESNINKAKIEYDIMKNATIALDLAPNLAESHRAMALAYSVQKRKDESIDEIKKSLELNKIDPESNLWFSILEEDKNSQNRYLTMSYTLSPESPIINMFTAIAYDNDKKTWDRDTQINYMKKAVDLAPQNDLAYMLLGNWYFKYKNDHENAIKNLEKALEIDPNTPFTLFQLGIIYLTKKNDLKAVEYLKKSCDKGMKEACTILKDKNY